MDSTIINNTYFFQKDGNYFLRADCNHFIMKSTNYKKDINNNGSQRKKGDIFINTEDISLYNTINNHNQNDIKYMTNNNKNNVNDKYDRFYTLNKSHNYRKINNLHQNNYINKNTNSNNKLDLSKTSKIPIDRSYINTSDKNNNYQIKKQIKYYNNNTFNYNKISLNKSMKKGLSKKNSLSKDYNYKTIINTNINNYNNISLNNLIINRQKEINQKIIENQNFDFIKKNEEKEDLNKIVSYKKIQKVKMNKSMDSKRLNKNSFHNIAHIIHVNNGNIINLSNLNNFSNTTDKYNIYYENKRTIPNLNSNNDKNKNSINYKNSKRKYINKIIKKEGNEKKIKNKNQYINLNNNPMKNKKNNIKKENNKYPLRINYGNENLSYALDTESLLDYNLGKAKNEYMDNISSKQDFKNRAKIKINNSLNNVKIIDKNHNLYNKKNAEKEKNLGFLSNNNKIYYHSERISSNDISLNKSLKKIAENIIQKENNLLFNGEKKETEFKNLKIIGNKKDKKEKIENKIVKKYSFSTYHNSLSFKPIKYETNNYKLKIKNNDRLMIINNENSNKINTIEIDSRRDKKRDRTYKISSHVVNEEFYKSKFTEKEINRNEENDLQISMQSLDDSKIMEMATHYITEEENLNKNEIFEILNSKKEKN